MVLTLPPSCANVPIVLKSGSLNLLEPSGSVQASNGIALPMCVCVCVCVCVCSVHTCISERNYVCNFNCGKYENIAIAYTFSGKTLQKLKCEV